MYFYEVIKLKMIRITNKIHCVLMNTRATLMPMKDFLSMLSKLVGSKILLLCLYHWYHLVAFFRQNRFKCETVKWKKAQGSALLLLYKTAMYT